MKRLTLEEAMIGCIELWDWLAEDGHRQKYYWLGWKRFPKEYKENMAYLCLACEYAEQTVRYASNLTQCDACPMLGVWGGKACIEMFEDTDSPYDKWHRGINRTENAKKIADGARKVLQDYYNRRGIKKSAWGKK